jgi:hypothetical protein
MLVADDTKSGTIGTEPLVVVAEEIEDNAEDIATSCLICVLIAGMWNSINMFNND